MTLFVCSTIALASLAKKNSTASEPESPPVSKFCSARLKALTSLGFLFLKESDLFISAAEMSLLHRTGIESASTPISDFIPTTIGEPLLVAIHSFGKMFDLKTQAKAPSSWEMVCSTSCLIIAELLTHLKNPIEMLPETVGWVLSIDVANKFSYDLRVGLRLENEPFAS